MKQISAQSLAVGLCIGGLMCTTNMYFGLQTGWVTMGSLQSAILGFGIFQVLKKQGWVAGFSIAENVIVQTCAVASATMPLAAGFVGVIPAMKHLTVDENPPSGPYNFSTLQLILWSTTLAFFGVFVAVPLRTQVIEREQLRFPSGTATAQIIKTLHATHETDDITLDDAPSAASLLQCPARVSCNSNVPFGFRLGSSRCSIERPYKRTTADVILSTALSAALEDEALSQAHSPTAQGTPRTAMGADSPGGLPTTPRTAGKGDMGGFNVASIETTWSALGWSFGISFAATGAVAVLEIFNRMQQSHVPTSVPVFGSAAAVFGWKVGANVGYVGQGMIMGPRVCISMLAGAVIGFAVLAPMAVRNGWATESLGTPDGSVAWVSWVAMSVMIADSLTSLAVLLGRYLAQMVQGRVQQLQALPAVGELPMLNGNGGRLNDSAFTAASEPVLNCETVPEDCPSHPPTPTMQPRPEDLVQQRIPKWAWVSGIVVSLCTATVVIGALFPMPHWQVAVAMCLAMLVAVLAVRALGETDLNPVSGIGKLAQVAFAVLAPGHVVPNLVAGAISEAAAAQAGDMMQDFKTAAILGVCPKCQFAAALLGSMASCWFSTAAYALFSRVYVIGGEKLPAPTAAIWIDMARLVTGGSLPPHVQVYCWAGAGLGIVLALLPDMLAAIEAAPCCAHSAPTSIANRIRGTIEWCLPSGIGMAIGAYILPQFVLPRLVGAIIAMPSVWGAVAPSRHQGSMLVVASGLVLGEGIASMVFTMIKSMLR